MPLVHKNSPTTQAQSGDTLRFTKNSEGVYGTVNVWRDGVPLQQRDQQQRLTVFTWYVRLNSPEAVQYFARNLADMCGLSVAYEGEKGREQVYRLV